MNSSEFVIKFLYKYFIWNLIHTRLNLTRYYLIDPYSILCIVKNRLFTFFWVKFTSIRDLFGTTELGCKCSNINSGHVCDDSAEIKLEKVLGTGRLLTYKTWKKNSKFKHGFYRSFYKMPQYRVLRNQFCLSI